MRGLGLPLASLGVAAAALALSLVTALEVPPVSGPPPPTIRLSPVTALSPDEARLRCLAEEPPLRRNEAGQGRLVYMTSVVDGQSPVLGLDLTVRVAKDDGTAGASSGWAGEIGHGCYLVLFSRADTNCRACRFQFTGPGAIPVVRAYVTRR
jgi:hypothetical protein